MAMRAKLVKSPDRITRPLPTAEYVMTTPDMAREWLATQIRNRPVHDTWVSRYADRMARGDWMATDSGVAFNWDGELMDGQHTLLALIKADRPVLLLVIRGLDPRAQLVMDQGIRRQVHEQIALREGWEVSPMHIAVAKAMVEGVGGPGAEQRRLVCTDAQLMERFYRRHHEAIEWTVAQFSHEPFVRGVTIAPVEAPVARAYYTEPHSQLMEFARIVVTGMSEHRSDQAAVALRNWLIAGRDKHRSQRTSGRGEVYRKTEIALQHFLKGLQLERLGQKQLAAELWPIPGEDVPREVVKAT